MQESIHYLLIVYFYATGANNVTFKNIIDK